MFYSPTTGGFYDSSINAEIPVDAVEITKDRHLDLLGEQSGGKKIVSDEDGFPVAITPLLTRDTLLASLADKRWLVETGGIYVDGRFISTDRESQAQLSSTYLFLKNDLVADTAWKSSDGTFSVVTCDELEPFAKAVSSHVRACFVAEQAHRNAILCLDTQTELNQYDINADWPEPTC